MQKNPVGGLISRLQAGLKRTEGLKETRHQDGGLGDEFPTENEPDIEQPKRVDQLALAICDIASHYGTPVAPASLTSGLPLVSGMIPLEHLEIATTRANLALDTLSNSFAKLTAHELPVLVLLSSGKVVIVWQLEERGTGVPIALELSEPGNLQSRKIVTITDIDATNAQVFRLHPIDGLDRRGREAVGAGAPKNWFLPAFKKSRKIYAEAIAATIAINILGLAVPLFSMNVYDRVLPNSAEATLWALAIGVLIAIGFEFMLRTLRAYFVDAASRRADVRLSNMIFGRLMGSRLSARSSSVGVRANTMREFETLREFINSATLTAFGDLPFLLLFIIVMWIVAGPLAFVVLAVIPIILCVGWLTQRSLDKLITQSFRESAQKNAVVVETISGIETIKAAGAESWAAHKWERSVAEHVRLGLRIRNVTNIGQNTIHSIQTLVQIAIVVIGFYIVAQGQMTMGALIAATILSGRALQPLAAAANLLARLNQTRIAYRSLSEIVNAPQERPEGEIFLSKTTCSGNVEFENVSFSYDEESQPALKDISVSISAGERVAIIGGIGSGKTTFLKLIQNLYSPSLGRVLIDGVSASQIEPSLLRQHVGLLLQDADLFHGTIRENITIADPSTLDDAIIEAAHTAGALEWISKQPKGFDTPVIERGSNLSGGQRQSIALARALLQKPKIIALDEPTSNMDGRTEQMVIARLKARLSDHTIILITHRPALLALVERIIVIEGSKKILDGPKNDVLEALKARSSAQTLNAKKRVKKTSQGAIISTKASAMKQGGGQ